MTKIKMKVINILPIKNHSDLMSNILTYTFLRAYYKCELKFKEFLKFKRVQVLDNFVTCDANELEKKRGYEPYIQRISYFKR